jgi:hyperosmotically inducible protein
MPLWFGLKSAPEKPGKGVHMKTSIHGSAFRWSALLPVIALGIIAGCSQTMKSPDVSDNIRKSLDQAGLKKVSVTQDRDKGVVTLGGQVPAEGDKAQAESVAKSMAAGQVVSNQIAVIPTGNESAAKTINSDLDKGIEQNLDAALVQSKLHDRVKYAVKNHVVTLTGEVETPGQRKQAEQTAVAIPNVQQVVNELQVKHQRATSSE